MYSDLVIKLLDSPDLRKSNVCMLHMTFYYKPSVGSWAEVKFLNVLIYVDLIKTLEVSSLLSFNENTEVR